MPGPAFWAATEVHEYACADDRADAKHCQIESVQLAFQRPFLGGFQNQVQRFSALKEHHISPVAVIAAGGGSE